MKGSAYTVLKYPAMDVAMMPVGHECTQDCTYVVGLVLSLNIPGNPVVMKNA